MKKVALVLLAVIMLVSLSACGKNSDSPYIGTWNSTGYEAMGTSFSVEEMGKSSMEIKNNGRLTMDFMGESGEGSWEEAKEGIKISDGSYEIIATMDEETMIIDIDGVYIYFEKEGGFKAGNSFEGAGK